MKISAGMFPVLLGVILAGLLLPRGALAQNAELLTLEEAIEIGLERSPDAMRAEAERLRGSVERRQSLSRLLPTVQLFSGLDQVQTLQRTATDPVTGGVIVLPDTLIDLRQRYGNVTQLQTSWRVFEGGRGLATAAAARSRGVAADEGAHVIRTRVAADITLAFLDALEANAVVEVREAEVERAQELRRTAEGRFSVGEVPEIDVLQARLEESDAEISLLEAEERAEIARLTLLEHTGLPSDRPWELVAPTERDVELDGARIRELAVARSPVIAEIEARRAAAGREARAQRLAFIPEVSLGASWVRSGSGITRDALTTTPRNTQAYYQLGLSWSPLGAMGTRHEARATELRADADLITATRRLEHALESGIDRLERARTLRERSVLNLELAERQREQAEERYRLGVAPIVERLTASTLWAEAALQAIVARYAPLRSLAELEHATGTPLRSLLTP